MITPNYLDLVLWSFNHVMDGGWTVLGPAVMWLFWTMAGIYLLWSCCQVMLKTAHPVIIAVSACFSFTKVFVFHALMASHQRLTDVLVTVMTNIGLTVATAAGLTMTPEQFFSPGTILALSWTALTPMVNHWNTVGGLGVLWYAGPFVMYLLTLLCCTIAFLLISLHVLVALATYKILALFSYPLMALGVFPVTSFVAKSCLESLLAGAVRLGTLALVCAIILPLIERLGMPANASPDYWSAMSTAAGSILLAFLSWKAPQYASELVGGRISAAAGDLLAMVTGATYGAARLASGGQRAATQVAAQVRETYAEHRVGDTDAADVEERCMRLGGRRKVSDETETFPTSFYLDEHLGAVERLNRVLTWVSIGGWCVGIVLTGGIIYVASQGTDVLHIIEVYPGDQVVYRGTAASTDIKDVWVETQLREWLYWVRRRSDDPVIDKEMRRRALKMTTGAATKDLDDYLTRELAAEEADGPHQRQRVTLTLKVITPESPTQWRIRWDEEWTPRIGYTRVPLSFDGTFVIEHRLKRPGLLGQLKIEAKDMAVSPLGVFVQAYRWSEIAQPVAVP